MLYIKSRFVKVISPLLPHIYSTWLKVELQ